MTYEPTRQTVAERWDEMTHDERGAWMREWGILCYADQQGATTITGWFEQEGPVSVVPAALSGRAGDEVRFTETALTPV